MKKLLYVFMFILLFVIGLAACSSKEPSVEELLEEAETSYGELESVKVDFKEDIMDVAKGELLIDLEDNVYGATINKDIYYYLTDDGDYAKVGDEVVELTGDDTQGPQLMRELFENPLTLIKEVDGEFDELLNLDHKEDKEQYILTLEEEAEEDDIEEFAEDFIVKTTLSDGVEEVTVDDFSLKIIIGEESKLIEEIKIKADVELELDVGTEDVSLEQTYKFSDYDDIGKIEKIEEEDINDTGDIGIKDEPSIDDGGDNQLEDAKEYVDAVIQATVYQDDKEFIKRAPDILTDKEKEEQSIVLKESFKEVYIQNTKQNYGMVDIDEKKFEELADAFLRALEKTKYSIVDLDTFTGDYIVTLEIEGLDTTGLYDKVGEELNEAIESGKVESEQELAELNLDLTIEYMEDVKLSDPVEVDVGVSDMNGQLVVEQDDYLMGGFVNE